MKMNASVRDSKAQSGSLNRGKSFFVIVIVLLLMANIVTVGFLVYSYLGREDSVQQFVNEYPHGPSSYTPEILRLLCSPRSISSLTCSRCGRICRRWSKNSVNR